MKNKFFLGIGSALVFGAFLQSCSSSHLLFAPNPAPVTVTPSASPTAAFSPQNTGTATRTATVTATFSPTSTPTGIYTPLATATGTATITPTASPTPTVVSTISCSSPSTLGDTVSSGSFTNMYNLRTFAQQYNLAQPGTIQNIWLEGDTSHSLYQVGIYSSDTNGLPQSLLCKSASVTVNGLTSVPVPSVSLPTGTYWLAYSYALTAPGGTLALAPGSTAQVSLVMDARLPANWFFCSTPVPSPTPTPVCTPPVFSYGNQVVIYAQICN